MPESFREQVDITSTIKAILDSYPSGVSLFREILQNSDDAGARKQVFVLDRRQHGTDSVLDPSLAATQGPALICYNNSIFCDSDWKALQTIHGSNKIADETKIGKYGLGFRSTYHVTDNPHILSGSRLVIFDPHESFEEPNVGGVAINFLTEGHLYPHQLDAFRPLLATTEYLPGTIVRLPLRTTQQALASRIKKNKFTPDEIKQLMLGFLESEINVAMLFLKHVTSIELQEIDVDGQLSVLGHVSIEDDASISHERAFERGNSARFETFRCTFRTPSGQRSWRICHSVLDVEETTSIMSKRMGYDIRTQLSDDKLFSHVAVAYPLDMSIERGRLFTLLPLPIYTDFPLHLHAILALTSDRQSLRNKEETGSNKKSRERFLVEWNATVFDTFVPRLWSQVLDLLVAEDAIEDVWAAWPSPTASHPYWSGLLDAVAREAASQGKLIFPTVAGDRASEIVHVGLKDAFIAPPGLNIGTLQALARGGCIIVQPPRAIYDHVLPFATCVFGLPALHLMLKANRDKVACLSAADKQSILDFFLSPPTRPALQYLLDLPIIPTIDNTFVSFSLTSSALTVASEDEEFLFGAFNSTMVSLRRMKQSISDLICDPSCTSVINVRRLDGADVVKYLHTKFGTLDPNSNEVECIEFAGHLDWLKVFWKWADLNPRINPFKGLAFMNLIKDFHLIPTACNRLRKVCGGFLSRDGLETVTIDALGSIGVPFLHGKLTQHVPLVASRQPSDVAFVLDNISSAPSSDSVEALQKYLVSYASIAAPWLTTQQRNKVLALPVFPTVVSQGVRSVTSIAGEAVFLQETECPLPYFQKKTTCLDVSPSQKYRALATYVSSQFDTHALDELGILKLSIPIIAEQPHPLIDTLAVRIITRSLDIPPSLLTSLSSRPFVLVKDGQRKAPSDVVDPSSPLAALYHGEEERFPDGCYNIPNLLNLLRPLLLHLLTPDIIKERIRYLCSAASVTTAQYLLELLNTQWLDSFEPVVRSCLEIKWIPGNDGLLHTPSESYSASTAEMLFDLVLHPTSVLVTSGGLRQALGWPEGIPFSIVLEQLRHVVDLEKNGASSHRDRALAIIKGFAKSTPSASVLAQFTGITAGKDWLPTHSQSLLVSVHHAYFDEDVELGGVFHKLHSDVSSGAEREMLLRLGCLPRPSFEALVEELHVLKERNSSSSPKYIIKLLEELSLHRLLDLPIHERERILVPVSEAGGSPSLQPIATVFYNDLPTDPRFPDRPYRLSNIISCHLAEALGVPLASALNLDLDSDDNDDDDDGLDMGEDFCARISGVLKDYDISHDLNEFVANASDAGATKFSLCLDRRAFNSDRLISPKMAEFNQSPSILLYNNATFSQKDFVGIRKIGQGGKAGEADTIGRFGLGALTVFHFTDLPMIVSAGHVLFLDPSGEYLPRQNGRRRTALLKRLSWVAENFPAHLAPLESKYGFSCKASEFNGTIFRLPLRAKSSPLSNRVLCAATFTVDSDLSQLIKDQYFHIARSSLLFTQLQQISAEERSWFRETPLWNVVRGDDGNHDQGAFLSKEFSSHFITISYNMGAELCTEESWLVSSLCVPVDEVPREFSDVLDRQKLLTAKHGIQVGIAAQLQGPSTSSQASNRRKSHIFSSLRLPITTSLPVQLNASFVLAPDRRNIRLDAPDNCGRRPAEANFNAWILAQLVPDVYMSCLANLASYFGENRWEFWPSTSKDPISEIVIRSFYQKLPACEYPICVTADRACIIPSRANFSTGVHPPPLVRNVVENLGSPSFVRLPDFLGPWFSDVGLPAAGAHFVRKTILDRANAYHNLWLEDSNLASVSEVLVYLLEHNVSPAGLCLLQLQNGELQTLSRCIGKVQVFVHEHDLSDIFPTAPFLSSDYSRKARGLLIANPSLGVQPLEKGTLMDLLESILPVSARLKLNTVQADIVAKIWKKIEGGVLPDLTKSARFCRLPLISTHLEGEFVSLELASSNGVIASEPTMDVTLAEVLNDLDIVVLEDRPECHRNLSIDGLSLPSLTSKLARAGRLSLQPPLRLDRHHCLAAWVRDHILTSKLSRETRINLRTMPLWPAWSNGGLFYTCANDINMLPNGISLDAIKPYALPSHKIAQYSQALMSLHIEAQSAPFHALLVARKRRGYDQQQLDLPAIPLAMVNSINVKEYLRFPDTLAPTEVASYSTLTRVLIEIGASDFKIPDGNLKLRPIHELYDHTVELFSSSFVLNSHRKTNFMHTSLMGFQRLRDPRLGLQSQVNEYTLLACARAIHTIVDPFNFVLDIELRDRTQKVFQHYCMTLPTQVIPGKAFNWGQFESLRFIPRARRNGREDTYNKTPYCNSLPFIVSPSQMVLPDYINICWSQKATWDDTDVRTSDVTMVHRMLGMPSAQDVVQHLRVLTSRVAIDHTGNAQVLSSITATYKWLQDNLQVAAHLLNQHLSEALFLNVDDPAKETWNWQTARVLVFDLDWDSNKAVGVRDFLLPYSRLLRACGVHTLSRPSCPSTAANTKGSDTSIRSRYNELRKEKYMTDLVFKPQVGAGIEEAGQPDLHAHSSFLVAMIPHVRDALECGMEEKTRGIFHFQGTYFAARAILDFVYTGDVIVEQPVTGEGLSELLAELLDVLPSADAWSMPDLKAHVGVLLHRHGLLTPDTYTAILDTAEMYNAKEIIQYCQEYQSKNSAVLQRIQEEL